ncbi:cytochrome-c peroxidase [Pseudomonadota bacterium]
MKRSIMLCLMLGLAFAQVGFAGDAKKMLKKASRYFEPLPATMPGAESDTLERIALGKKLFFDPRLSINDTQSCASCHRLAYGLAGVDNLPTSPGAEGKVGTRNSPTVLNAGYQFAQFWDGRAADLVEQAKGPIINPIEMGMPNETAVEEKIRGIVEYRTLFAKAFPKADEPITYQNLAEAIAAFERTLRTDDRFNDFLNGDLEALNEQELKGLATFMKLGCTSCHDGPLLGGSFFEKLGKQDAVYENQSDLGLYEATKKEEDKMYFKVPSLRNVALTAPYYHDGRLVTLEDAVRSMGILQRGGEPSAREIEEVVTFLKALTGKELVKAAK